MHTPRVLAVERLRHLQDAFSKAADAFRTRADRYAEQDDQRAHRPQEPGPHRGREAGH